MEANQTVNAPSANYNLSKKNIEQVTASNISFILDECNDEIKILSLDCFDTLIWRKTAAPKDVFYAMQQRPLFQSLGVTAYQRISAAALAYRMKFITHGTNQILLSDIYSHFSALTKEQQYALAEEEILAEIDACYAFPPVIELIRKAKSKGLKIIIVSDTYFTEAQLKRILQSSLPPDVMEAISAVFCSQEFGLSKTDGLFEPVLEKLSVNPQSILHVGDHHGADFLSPKKLGVNTCHFLQFNDTTTEFLRIQHAASALSAMSDPAIEYKRPPRYSLFRGIFSHVNFSKDKPESIIGYLSFGPMLYAFAKFLCDDLQEIQASGKKVKVFFLMRDAYLLAKACETYAGEAVGKCVRIRKFIATAAHFRTTQDIDNYIGSLTHEHYNFWVICEQLLLPKQIASAIIQTASTSQHPQKTFNDLIHQDSVLQFIFQQSAAYRERLKRYIKKEMNIEEGDTIVLVDTGYIGLTQRCLTSILNEDMHVDVVGRYFISSHEPNRPPSKALMTSTICDHGLFEQSCTFKEGAVIDYDQEGNPIFDQIRLSDAQYAKVQMIQDECLRFIKDAKQFFSHTNIKIPFSILQATAISALKRHMYFPLKSEVDYFQIFQHDKDMGPTLKKTMYDVSIGLNHLKQNSLPFHIKPYEQRAASLEIALSTMMKNTYDLEFLPEDMSLRQEKLKIILVRNGKSHEMQLSATHTHDGYFSLIIPIVTNDQIGVQFGEAYKWFEIERINLLNGTQEDIDNSGKNITFHQMNKHENLFENTQQTSLIAIACNFNVNRTFVYQIIFRPLVRRDKPI